jgi:hypothetical protein
MLFRDVIILDKEEEVKVQPDYLTSNLSDKAKYAMHVWFVAFGDTLPLGAKIAVRLNFEWSGHFSSNLYIQVKTEGSNNFVEIPYLDQFRPTKASTAEEALNNLIKYLEKDTDKKKKQTLKEKK